MATQTIDFSNVETVIKNGQYLTSIVLDGVTVWDSSHVGLLWQKAGPNIYSGVAGEAMGASVAIRDDGNRAAILHGGTDIAHYDYNGSYWILDYISYVAEGTTRSNLNYVGDDLYYLERYESSFNSNVWVTRFAAIRQGSTNLYKNFNGNYNYMAVNHDGGVYVTGNDRLIVMLSVGPDFVEYYDKSSDAPSSGNNPRIAFSSSLVVAYGNQAAVRGGNNRAGEVQVYDESGNQKGPFIVGEVANLYLGKFVQISDDGNRIAVATRTSVRIYDWDGAEWVQNVPAIVCTLGGGRIPWALEANADLSRIACVFSNSASSTIDKTVVEVFEYNGASVGLVGGTISPLPFDDLSTNPTLSLSRDGNHVIIGDFSDDQSGENAGSAVVYSLSAL